MKNAYKLLGLILLNFCISSCVRYEVKLAKGNEDRDGIRYFRPHPYILIAREEDGKNKTTLIYLPDRSKEYIIQRKGLIGKAEVSFKLDNGWNLVEYGSVSDSQTAEILTAAGGLIPNKATADERLTTEANYLGLYRVDFAADGHVKTLVKVPF